MSRVVLAYSGGLDTSVILKWLIEERGYEVICYTADVGQGEDVEAAVTKAYDTGAVEAFAEDLREEFVADYVWPAIRANAVYENYYLLGTSLARPVIAKGLVQAAERYGAEAISHGATGKGNDQVRFELSAYALNPDIRIVAPWREWSMRGRADLVEYAEKHDIPIPVTPEKPYSTDANLLHISYEGGVLEDPWVAPPPGIFEMTVDPEEAPDQLQEVVIEFEGGTPVAVDGERMSPAELLGRCNRLAGAHGIGRVDLVENRFVGMKNRGVYETPGGTLLHHAHRAVESLTLDREPAHLRDRLMPEYAELVYNGFWFSPERTALQNFMDDIQSPVTGEARLRLYKGNVITVGRRSPTHSLYDEETVTFEAGGTYDQSDATGFIRLNALRLRLGSHRGSG
ncbi:MAG: argininosuccinate synthase [Acidimicrobiia bacterium]|nr:argininosuccinate synthase [bacterium]MXX64020.1 argininosuccinate synthase [Acidimicrobiia bacterium]MCY3579507.1 argininosuccinate synthase [bacterium]MCY3652249.1 argininosuccinate synthase [bacterium]MDE0643447.1 argininosuccinate synthase [bacterium]